jgi:hypothetical protein
MQPINAIEHIEASMIEMLAAIDLLVDGEYQRPALILIYSAIDASASLARPVSKEYSTRQDFFRWVDRYLLTSGAAPRCSAIDLYAARCGLLHTHAPEAALSDSGEARIIGYAWGNASVDVLRDLFVRQGRSQTHAAVHIDELVAATKRAVATFLEEVRSTPSLRAVVWPRARMLAAVSTAEANEYSAYLEGG